MAKKTILIKSKERLSRADAAEFLRQLADKLEAGNVLLIQGTQEVSLEVPAQLTLEVDADDKRKKRGTKRSLEIEMEWYLGAEGEAKSGLELG